ncbi:MAG: DUF4838 domain-containing protein [Sediminibacterium sp.]|nr:DUF4838 domain-containing protein [Sediminibacterium sp.]
MQLFVRTTFSFLFLLLLSFNGIQANAQKAPSTSFKLVQQGSSKAVIQIAENADSDERLAATELSDYVFKITGARIPVVSKKSTSNPVIYIGQACPNYAALIKKEYAITSTNNTLQITGATPYQTLETVYVLLEEFLGCQFLSPTVEKIPTTKNIVVAADYQYTPAVLTRTVHSKLFYDNPSFAAKRRVTTEGFPKFVPEARVHTFNKFLPEKNFFENHPTFYALVKNKRQPTQLCLSNDTVYQIIKDSVAAFFNRRPSASVLSVSQDDNTQYCTCDKCAAIDAYEGSPSGTMITLVNRIAKDFPNKTIATAPFPNLETLQPNINLFVDNNANWIFEQHSHNPSEFFELRSWLLSKFLWNPKLNYANLLQEFANNYYGVASLFIVKYLNDLHAAIKETPKFYLFLYGDPAQGFETWLSEQKLKQYNALFDSATNITSGNAALQARVHEARIGLDFATLEFYRLNKASFPLSDVSAIQKRVNRFTTATGAQGIKIINEMGLPLTDYLQGYQKLIASAKEVNKAKNSKVTLAIKPVKYAKEDPQALTDGAFGGWSFYANWLGFLDDMKATIDLGAVTNFSEVSVSFLQVTNHVVFFPTAVTFEASEDGINYTPIQTIDNVFPLVKTSKVNDIQVFATSSKSQKARFIRVTGKNMKSPPYWHHAAGTGAWIFADEIVVK